MGRHMRKILAVLTVVVLAVSCLAGCGRGKAEDGQSQGQGQGGELTFGEDIFFSVKFNEQDSYAQEWEEPVQAVVGENYVWTLTSGRAEYVYERDLKTGSVQYREYSQGEKDFIMSLSALGDSLYASVGTGESVQVRKLLGDAGWQTIMEISGEMAPEQIQPTIFFVDQSENAYFVDGNQIVSFSPDGGEGSVYELKEPVAFLREDESGVCAVTNSRREICLYTLGEGGTAEKVWTLRLPSDQVVEIRTDDPNMLGLALSESILFLDSSTGEITGQFNCVTAGISTDLFGGLYLASEGILYLDGRSESRTGVWQELAQREDGAESRTELIYNTIDLSATMKERIVSFNQSNEEYYITIQEYRGGGGMEDWETQLQASFASGNGPDIVDLLYGNHYVSYVEKGILEDLDPYLQGEDFYDDLFWEVLDMYRVNGKLCMVVPHFKVFGLHIHPDYAQYVDIWNYETFEKLVEMSSGELDVIYFSSPENLLNNLLSGMEGEFIDMNEKQAYFDTPEFISMLELCKEYGDGVFEWEDWGYSGDEVVDMVLLYPLTLSSSYAYIDLYGYGEDVVPYGYPTVDGEVYSLYYNFDACGIYSGSPNKEGAWEFVRTLFAEDYQTEMTGRSEESWGVRKSCWYHSWDYLKSSDGIKTRDGTLPPPTDEDVEYFMNLIQSVEYTVSLAGNDIRDIIMEEAGVYFSGDKSAEDVAGVIQNRVQLMLNEM